MYASGDGDEQVVQLLLAHNASVVTEDSKGKTALLWAMEKNGRNLGAYSSNGDLQDYQMQFKLLEQQN